MISLRWAVIGLGRAGLARVRALNSLNQSVVALCSRRGEFAQAIGHLSGSTPPNLYQSPEELFEQTALDAVCICSENHEHALHVSLALARKVHVCVEFPLATSTREAQRLFDLANQMDRILHVEVIGVLTSSHLALQSTLQDQTIRGMKTELKGGLYRWVERAALRREWGSLSFGRIYRAVHLYGPLKLKQAALCLNYQGTSLLGYRLNILLSDPTSDRMVDLSEERSIGGKRESSTWMIDSTHHLQPMTITPSKKPLFEQDLELCLNRIEGKKLPAPFQHYSEHEDLLIAHELCDRIDDVLNHSLN